MVGDDSMSAPAKVFVSYSHDSPAHADRVLALADQLRADGVDVALDQYDPNPAEGWPLWMEKNLDDAPFVLMVCTETYRRRVMGNEPPGTGLGVRWEGKLIYNRIYNDAPGGSRFIPILLDGGSSDHIPTPVLGHTRYEICRFDLSDPGYVSLYRHLTGRPLTPKPALGPLKDVPAHPRRTPPANP
jgi:TIR domain